MFSCYKMWQLITTISIARTKHSYLSFRFCTTVTKISLKSECFANVQLCLVVCEHTGWKKHWGMCHQIWSDRINMNVDKWCSLFWCIFLTFVYTNWVYVLKHLCQELIFRTGVKLRISHAQKNVQPPVAIFVVVHILFCRWNYKLLEPGCQTVCRCVGCHGECCRRGEARSTSGCVLTEKNGTWSNLADRRQ